MRVMPHPRQITSINFADTFAHSLVSVAGMVKNVAHILVEAFVTQRLTSHRYACGLAASAGDADAALRFLQAIDPAHCLASSGEPMKKTNEVLNGAAPTPLRFSGCVDGWRNQ
jgi:hypothetical protein